MLRRLKEFAGRLARRKVLAILAVALAPLLLRALLLPWMPMPEPRLHDEFSHLLAADTFAHGRLVNPVHPRWMHFESMHILVRPVYASIFPAASGLVMAVAKVVTGHPWIGVWLSVGFMCAALCWMLQGWVSPGWALLGGVLAAIRFGVFSYWMNSYYGGALAAAGGALVLGAFARVVMRPRATPRWINPAILGIGLAILANTRPFEGAIFGAPIVLATVWPALVSLVRRRNRSLTTLAPLLLVLVAAAAALGYYCSRFTGNPLQLPYSFYRSTFTVAPHFVVQSPRVEPVYLHRELWKFHTISEMGAYRDARANRSPYGVFDKSRSYWRFYLGPFLSISLLAIPWMWKRRRTRFLLALAALFSLALLVEVWNSPHYAAPALGLCLLLVIEGLRHLRQIAGTIGVVVVALGCLLTPVIHGSSHSSDGSQRARVLKQLKSEGGRHLVVVRYGALHDPGDEWVYNSADIDGSSVVWAREMDPASNRNLLRYFKDRRVWMVQPDVVPAVLVPYDASQLPDPLFRFVKLGTPEIEVLRSADDLRRTLLHQAAHHCGEAPCQLSCDVWNALFSQSTGIAAPDPSKGCFVPGARERTIEFDAWFAWLKQQR